MQSTYHENMFSRVIHNHSLYLDKKFGRFVYFCNLLLDFSHFKQKKREFCVP